MKKFNYNEVIHDTWNVLSVAYRLIGRLWENELKRFNFTKSQALNLSIIKHLDENATPYRISRFQIQEHNTVSDMLNRMEKMGLVKKIREPQGKSRVKVTLTNKGEKAYQQSLERESLLNIFSILSKKELEQLRGLLEKLRDEALKEFDQDQKWQEIRIPPSEWKDSDLFKKSINNSIKKSLKARRDNTKSRKKEEKNG